MTGEPMHTTSNERKWHHTSYINYHLNSGVSIALCFSYVQPVTQQYCLKSSSTVKLTAMKIQMILPTKGSLKVVDPEEGTTFLHSIQHEMIELSIILKNGHSVQVV